MSFSCHKVLPSKACDSMVFSMWTTTWFWDIYIIMKETLFAWSVTPHFLLLQTLGTADLLFVSMDLPLLLSLASFTWRNIIKSHPCWWDLLKFLFLVEYCSITWLCHVLFSCSISWWMFGLSPFFWNCESCCCERLCAGFCVLFETS